MPVLLANNAASRLAASIDTAALEIAILAGDGVKFPAPSAGDWFPLTLIKPDGGLEILRATARNGDVITIQRAQEGTPALAFTAGDRVELRTTAGAMKAELLDNLSIFLPPGTGPLPWSRIAEPLGWIFCDARVLLPDTAYQALRSAYIADGFPYGQDGAGNPYIPDARGRTMAGKDNMGGTAAGRLGGIIVGSTLGAAAGSETHILSLAEMPYHNHGGTTASENSSHQHSGNTAIESVPHTHAMSGGNVWKTAGGSTLINTAGGSSGTGAMAVGNNSVNHTHGFTSGSQNSNHQHTFATDYRGSNLAHSNMQPTIITNMIIKT